MKQKFKRGDLVQVVDNLGSSMSHFPSGHAIVLGSYADIYFWGSREVKAQYSLMFTDTGDEVSWYHEHQLELLPLHSDYIIDMVKAMHTDMKTYRDKIQKLKAQQDKLIAIIIGEV